MLRYNLEEVLFFSVQGPCYGMGHIDKKPWLFLAINLQDHKVGQVFGINFQIK